VARTVAQATARLGDEARTVAAGCAQYDALGGEPSLVVTVTEPGWVGQGQGQGPAAGDPGVVTWVGSLGVAGRGALVSEPDRPFQPWPGPLSCDRLWGAVAVPVTVPAAALDPSRARAGLTVTRQARAIMTRMTAAARCRAAARRPPGLLRASDGSVLDSESE
jgi:hypothetical protein